MLARPATIITITLIPLINIIKCTAFTQISLISWAEKGKYFPWSIMGIQRGNIIVIVLTAILAAASIFVLLNIYIRQLKQRLSYQKNLSNVIVNNAEIIILAINIDGIIIGINKYAEEITGFTQKEISGKNYLDGLFSEDMHNWIENIFEDIINGKMTENYELPVLCKNGEFIDVLWKSNVLFDSKGKGKIIIATGIDITERKRIEKKLTDSCEKLELTNQELVKTQKELIIQIEEVRKKEEELRVAEERYRLAVDGVNDGIWDWNIEGSRIFVSEHGKRLLEIQEEIIEPSIKFVNSIIYSKDVKKVLRTIQGCLDSKTSNFQFEFRINKKNKLKWILARGQVTWDQASNPLRMIGSLSDVTRLKEREEKIQNMAFYDSLTGLPNRTLFLDRLKMAMAQAERKKLMAAVLFLDLDNFKIVNDSLGHSFGDLLLKKVGNALNGRMRKVDTVARVGGDEFIILLPNVKELSEVDQIADRILGLFHKSWDLEGHSFQITASIGITMYPNDGTDIKTLFKNADIAMYRAKELGKNNYQLYC